jgi:hypothetical protein
LNYADFQVTGLFKVGFLQCLVGIVAA